MAESSRRRKSKESKTAKKTKLRYVRDEEFDDDLLDLGLSDVEQDNFNPTSNLCDDHFLNILCDNKMLKNNQFEGDDEVDVKDIHQVEHEHEHLEDENELEVGVEFRVHDPTVKWNQMKPTAGDDKSKVLVRCGKKLQKSHVLLGSMLHGSTTNVLFR
uniref:Uncharacterized protein n=1 Tax=Lactuca sativa TaxID=4236 RepID=A0A9R1UC88_LACSA|nr:hypothetical protein LSAT_V11C900477070 [Lactuca sativa]